MHGERRLQPGEGLQRGAGAHVLVALQDRQPVAVAHRDDRPGEPAVRPRLRGPGLRLDGVGVDIRAREPVEGGDEIGTDALRDEADAVGGVRVHRVGAAVGAHRHAGHRLDSAGEDEVLHPGADLHRRDVHGLEPGGAEPVDLQPCDRLRQAGGERGRPGDDRALVADRRDHAEHDVVDRGGVERRESPPQLVDQADDQRDRLDLVERPGRLAAPAGRADRLVDVGLGYLRHRCPLLAPHLHTPAPRRFRRSRSFMTGPGGRPGPCVAGCS